MVLYCIHVVVCLLVDELSIFIANMLEKVFNNYILICT